MPTDAADASNQSPSAPRPITAMIAPGLLASVIIIAIVFRFYELGRLPGLNGDEAWYGAKLNQWAAGLPPIENRAVDWRTPTGNLPGPLHLGGLALLQSLLPPSFALLRLPAVLSSLGAMALAFMLCRRFFGPTAAMIALVLMATLPANIVYARFGWDPSHSALVILASAYAALARRPILSALAFALALAVHPTNVFVAPFLLSIVIGVELERGRSQEAFRRIAVYAALLLASLSMLPITTSGAHSPSLASIAERLSQPAEYLLFPVMLLRLVTGDTALMYITGQGWGAWRILIDAAAAASFAFLLAISASPAAGKFRGRDLGLVAGWLVSLIAFFILAGTRSLMPGLDRYALCLIVPTVLMLAVLISRATGPAAKNSPVLMTGTLGLALLAGFWMRYFEPLERGRGGTHRTFWTASTEPKQAAHNLIAAEPGARRATIYAEDYWLYWPLVYLDSGRPIIQANSDRAKRNPLGSSGPVYWVVWRGGPTDRKIAARFAGATSWTLPSANRDEAVRVWRLDPGQAAARQIAPSDSR